MNIGDKLVLAEGYYIWTYPDGQKQLVCSTLVKPAVKGEEYLLFLRYQKDLGAYYAVGDYQGVFDIPENNINAKGKIASVGQPNMDRYYDGEPLHFLNEIYNEVVEKYFK
ncbi:MAG TPA: hypothetical protein PLD49_06805 [Thermoclostridium caenicola]|uniref:Uncharacterized protein n=1 Tax=Thermoclostridium caenicola TaxID=659425 RepID=A0A1M6C3B5_9FIRM|nr:hypothetical protein [Thermoclostridium caenicola]SHI55499.1 hypothetical protein SAMN05444373_100433 [Thermoclostridium caenicola]HOK43358.1 hypothetical protein [Thermoclostridium caenicola]HOL84625.1 hypothetical protein [Thermoclostridium caenicola]HPO76742.1 hypothetical protein [Thermoclostridium caenicola]